MTEEIKTAIENLGKALAHPDFKLSQAEHFQLAKDFNLIVKELTPKDDIKKTK
jgi:hypothetical protein